MLYEVITADTNLYAAKKRGRNHRITSYNVCYTKLLRSSIALKRLTIAPPFARTPAPIDIVTVKTAGIATGIAEIVSTVITSYSIHYTKLYD